MRVTLRHLFTPAITVQYPTVRRTLPLRSLNRHVLTVDLGNGKLKCTACDACAKVCPTRCITIVGAGKGKERHPVEFVIDHNLCMYCNLCVEACPFDAITMWTGNFEIGAFNRTGLGVRSEGASCRSLLPDAGYPGADRGAGRCRGTGRGGAGCQVRDDAGRLPQDENATLSRRDAA